MRRLLNQKWLNIVGHVEGLEDNLCLGWLLASLHVLKALKSLDKVLLLNLINFLALRQTGRLHLTTVAAFPHAFALFDTSHRRMLRGQLLAEAAWSLVDGHKLLLTVVIRGDDHHF